MFGIGAAPKKTMKEEGRAAKKDLRRGGRELERERKKLEREEAKIAKEIKKAAKSGDMATARAMAKEMTRIRAAKARFMKMGGTMKAMEHKTTTMVATAKMSEVMGKSADVMATANKKMNPTAVAGTMQNFARQMDRMGMTEDMMNDALEDMFEDDSDEENAVVSQVLDELGVEMAGSLVDAPSTAVGAGVRAPASGADVTDAEVARVMKELGV